MTKNIDLFHDILICLDVPVFVYPFAVYLPLVNLIKFYVHKFIRFCCCIESIITFFFKHGGRF